MSDRPILFSGPMVRALLEGRKTQTRRVIKPRPWNSAGDTVDISRASAARITIGADGRSYVAFDHPRGGPLTAYVAPYVVGDRLWVRETGNWRGPMKDHIGGGQMGFTFYAADSDRGRSEFFDDKNRPGIFMPRWASRLTLTVTDVRVQRLQEISPADAIAEGIAPAANSLTIDCDTPNPVDGYQALWDKLNAERAPWTSNPWIVAVTFTVEQRNIDDPSPTSLREGKR